MMRAQVCRFGRLNRSAELWQHPPTTRIDGHTTRFELHFVKIGQQVREHEHTRRDDGDGRRSARGKGLTSASSAAATA